MLAAGGANGRGCWSAAQSIVSSGRRHSGTCPVERLTVPFQRASPGGQEWLRMPGQVWLVGPSHLVHAQHPQGPGPNENSEALVQS